MAKEMKSPVKVATLAVSIALVTVFTSVVKIPTPTGGYLNCSDIAICFIAYTMGPVTAFVAGGVGAALADIIGGWFAYAPITFVCHGLEGLLMALIISSFEKKEDSPVSLWLGRVLAAIVCMICVAGGYYLLEGIFMQGFAAAITEVPGNLAQSGVGVVVGFLISEAVRKAYPPVKKMSW